MPPAWEEPWQWFADDHRHQAATTLRDRRTIVLAFAHWAELSHGITSPDQVTKRHLTSYMSMIEDTRRGSGAITVFNGLRTFWRWYAGAYKDCKECADPSLYVNHSCSLTPVHGVRRPAPSKHQSATVPVPTDDDISAVLKALNGNDYQSVRDRALISLLSDTGTRRGEIRMIDVADLDMTIPGGGTAHVRVSKTKARSVVFGPDTKTHLRKLLLKHPLRDDPRYPDVPLFTNSTGGRLSPQSIGMVVARAGKRAGVEFTDGRRLHPHQMRHAFADRMYRAQTPDAVLRQLGGWVGTIPATYGLGAASDRAVEYALRQFNEKR
jgi:integrase